MYSLFDYYTVVCLDDVCQQVLEDSSGKRYLEISMFCDYT